MCLWNMDIHYLILFICRSSVVHLWFLLSDQRVVKIDLFLLTLLVYVQCYWVGRNILVAFFTTGFGCVDSSGCARKVGAGHIVNRMLTLTTRCQQHIPTYYLLSKQTKTTSDTAINNNSPLVRNP